MSHLPAVFARRREAEHNRIERTEAANKYFDHWSKITARFENWTAPSYYRQAEQQLENGKRYKEKQKILADRQVKLAQLLETEKKSYEQEIREKHGNKNSRRSFDIKTLKKIEENLKEQNQIRRKLELEAKLYGKWRHGVEDDNLIFESKTDNEVLAKLNWLDKQVDQKLQREKEEEVAKELQLKLQLQLNKSEELQKERQQIRENEIHEIRCMQEHHLEQLKERQKETDEIKEKERLLKSNLRALEKELGLLEESYSTISQNIDFGDAYNFNKIKIFTRKRSEVFRNQISLCLCILERIINYCEKPEVLKSCKKHLEQQLEREKEKLSQIEGMYESEAKCSLQRSEELWQQEHTNRYKKLKQILMEEHRLINNSLQETIQKHEELVKIRSTHLSIIENSSEKLKLLIQEKENSPRCKKSYEIQLPSGAKVVHSSSTKNICNQFQESDDTPLYAPSVNNISPKSNEINSISNLFNNPLRSMQAVTSERPRFGRKRVAWN